MINRKEIIGEIADELSLLLPRRDARVALERMAQDEDAADEAEADAERARRRTVANARAALARIQEEIANEIVDNV